MKISQMTVFCEVMETGSVSQAARNLNRTQPSVSALIAALEEEIGLQLFERRGGRLHPVPEARYLHEECQDILRRVDGVTQTVRRVKQLEQGELKIASMPGPAAFLLPRLIVDHDAVHPGIQTTLVSRSSPAVYQLTAAQQFDVGIADHRLGDINNSAMLESHTVSFECLCAVPADSPLAQLSAVGPRELDGLPMGSLLEHHATSQLLVAAFLDAGVKLNIRYTTQYFMPLLNFVERGVAHVVLDPLSAESYRIYRGDNAGVVFRPFIPAIPFDVAILTPSARTISMIARNFRDRVLADLTRIADVDSTEV